MSIHVKQIAPDFYQVTFPNGHMEILRNKGGYIQAGAKQFNDMKWVVKYLERDYETNPGKYRSGESDVSVDEITLNEVPAGWAVSLRGRPMRCAVRVFDTWDRKLPPGTFHISAAGADFGSVDGMENALALATWVCSGLIRTYGPAAYRDYVDPNEKIVEGIMLRLLRESWDVEQEWHLPLLQQAGAWPLKTLGSGYYGTTYMCEMDDGSRKAVKVTATPTEAANYGQMRDLLQRAPANISRHFPKIYDIYESDSGFAIVMELLKPLPPDIADDMFTPGISLERGEDEFPSRVFNKVYGDPENLLKAINYGIDAYNNWLTDVVSRVRGRLDRGAAPERLTVSQVIFSSFPHVSRSERRAIEKRCLSIRVNSELPLRVADVIFDVIRRHVTRPDTTRVDLDQVLDALRDRIELTMSHAMDVSFPQHSDDIHPASKTWVQNPASRSLARALGYVYGNGIRWLDVKSDNLGLRPGTNDIVMFDLGLFSPRE